MSSIKRIITTALVEFDVTPEELKGNRRKEHIVSCKQAIAIAMNRAGYSTNKTFKTLGYKDHSTVSHLINHKPVQNQKKVDKVVKSAVRRTHHPLKPIFSF